MKYSVGYTEENKPVVIIDDDILAGVPKNQWIKTVKDTLSNKFTGGIPIKGRFIKVNRISKREYTNSKYSQNLKQFNKDVYKDKFKSANNLDEIIIASTNYVNEDLKHTRKDKFKEFARGDVLIRVGNNDYSAKVIIGLTTANNMVLYDIVDFVPTSLKIKKVGTHTAQQQNKNAKSSRTSVSTNTNIQQKQNNVKSNKNNGRNSVDDVIDENRDLVAVHNLSAKKLAVRLEKAFESTRKLNEQRASAAESTETEQKNNTHEGVKYSIDKSFEKKYDKWDKKSGNISFRVGSTSQVLQELGVDNKAIWWDSSKILKIKNKHSAMTDEIIKQVPQVLENPILVMESQTVKGRLTLFGDVYDNENNPVLVALELNPTNSGGKSLNIVKIASAYGKDVNLQGFINKSDILYVDPNKERTHNWLKVNRLKLPLLSSSNYGFFKTNIPQNNKNVKHSVDDTINNEYLKAVKNNDLETAQKLVDEAAKENGYIIKAYHGTSNGGFNVFDTYGSNFGLFGQGSYFTENKSVAESYTQKGKGDNKKVYECYLDIKNPLDMDKNANVEDWIRASGIDDDYYFEDCKTNEDCFKALKEYCQDDGMYKYEAESFIFDTILAMNYDGITHIGGGRYNKKDETRHRVWIAFEPNQIKSADPITYDDNGNVIPLSERFKNEKVDIRYSKDDKIDSDDKKITVGMSDSERAEILKNTVLTLADYEDAKNKVGKTVDTATVISLQDTVRKNANKILRVLGDKFKVFEKIYKNKNVNLEFDYSKISLKESVNKQGNISTDYSDFARMLCVFDEIVNNAVPIEVHTDRYAGTERHNPDLKYDYVLLSGFKDKEYIVPVELHIKEYFKRYPNKLYVSITLGKTKIEDNVVTVTTEPEKDSVRNTARLSSKVSLPQLISKVNSPYGNFYKYIPDELLNENQLALKAESLQDEEKMLSDLRKKNIPDSDVSEIKLAVDDTINDGMFADGDLFDEDGYIQQSVFERAVKDNPDFALTAVYNHAAKTAEAGLRRARDVKLTNELYMKIARRLMNRYEISPKLNKGFDEELAQIIKKHTKRIERGVTDFAGELELLVDDCKDALMLSGKLDGKALKTEREEILGYLRGKTLILSEYAESDVRGDYDTLQNYRKRMFGKINVAYEKNLKNNSKGLFWDSGNNIYINDVIAFVEERFPHLITDDADDISGYRWLDNLVNGVLKPKFVNNYIDGFYENIDTAAIEMAFDVTTEVINEKAKLAVSIPNSEHKLIKEIEAANKKAEAEQKALLKAKAESYRNKAKEERLKRIKKVQDLRQKMSEFKEKNDKEWLKYEAQIEHLKTYLDKKTIILNMGYETIRDQYNSNRERTANINSINKLLAKLEKRYLAPKPKEYIPADIYNPLHDVLTTLIALDGRSKKVGMLAEKMRTLIDKLDAEIVDSKSVLHIPSTFQDALLGYTDEETGKHVDGSLDAVVKIFANSKATSLKGFSNDEIKQIKEALSQVEAILHSATEIVLAKKRYNAYVLSREIEKEIEVVTGTHSKSKVGRALKTGLEMFQNEMNDAKRFARRMVGYKKDSLFVKFFDELNRGQTEAMNLQMEWTNKAMQAYSEFSAKELDDYKHKKALTIRGIDEKGKDFSIDFTADMLVEIVLEYQDKYAREHMMFSGYHVPNIDYLNKKNKNVAYSKDRSFFFVPTKSNIMTIKDYVKKDKLCNTILNLCYNLYNFDMQDAVNEISLRKYGYKLAKVRNYCPITIDTDTVEKGFADVLINRSINSRAFLHMRDKHRRNRLKLMGALDKLGRQIDSVSSWCGMTIPIENFTKVYNMERFDNSFADVDGKRKTFVKDTLPGNELPLIEEDVQLNSVLNRLANNEEVTLDEIFNLEIIQEAFTKRGPLKPTINDNSSERIALRKKIQRDIEKLGSAVAKGGKWEYNGVVNRDGRIDIVIGLPAAGKSSVIADPLSAMYKSRIVDSDVVKERLPEFNNGLGAGNVHEESKRINEDILEKAVGLKENIVLPIVGSDYDSVIKKIKFFKENGYNVYLHLNELPMYKALGRMINRFIETGRFLSPELIYGYQNKPTEVFERIIKENGGLIDGYSKDDNRGNEENKRTGSGNIQESRDTGNGNDDASKRQDVVGRGVYQEALRERQRGGLTNGYTKNIEREEEPNFKYGTENFRRTYDNRGNEENIGTNSEGVQGSRRYGSARLDKENGGLIDGYSKDDNRGNEEDKRTGSGNIQESRGTGDGLLETSGTDMVIRGSEKTGRSGSEALRERQRGGLIDGYSRYSNDVERGEEPIFKYGTEDFRKNYLDEVEIKEIVPKSSDEFKQNQQNNKPKEKDMIYFKSVKENIKLRWGNWADDYISKLMGKLQCATKAETSKLDVLTSNYTRGVLTGNINSAIVQISSYPLVASVVGWKPVAAGLKHIRPGKHTPGLNRVLSDNYKHSVPYDELAKYTPILWYRQQGHNNRDINEINKYKSLGDKSGILDKLNWIEKMDTIMVDMNYWICYEYVKNELKISPESKEFMPKVAETLEEIINSMMPNSSIMQQGQILRRDNPLLKVFTICKSQVFCMANAIMDSSGEYIARRQALKSAEQSDNENLIKEAKADLKESKTKYIRTFSSVTMSVVMTVFLLNVIKAFVTGKYDKYKDEDGNITASSVGLRMLKDFGSEFTGMFLFGDIIYNFALSCIDKDEKFWGVSYPGIEIINDLFTGINKLINSDEKNFLENLRNIIGTAGLAKGLPIKNMDGLIQGIYNHFVNSAFYDFTPAVNNKGEVTTKKFANTCYNALVDGNKQLYNTYHSQWLKQKKSNGELVDEKYINSKLKEELEDDKEIIAAADAFREGNLDKYEAVVEKYVGFGFKEETVTSAVDSIINETEKNEQSEKTNNEAETEEEEDKATLYTYSDAFEYLKNGDRENYERIEQYLIDNADKTKKDVQSAMRSASRTDELWKEYFEAQGTLSGGGDSVKLEELKKTLTNIYGSWSTAATYGRKYKERMKKKEREKNK